MLSLSLRSHCNVTEPLQERWWRHGIQTPSSLLAFVLVVFLRPIIGDAEFPRGCHVFELLVHLPVNQDAMALMWNFQKRGKQQGDVCFFSIPRNHQSEPHAAKTLMIEYHFALSMANVQKNSWDKIYVCISPKVYVLKVSTYYLTYNARWWNSDEKHVSGGAFCSYWLSVSIKITIILRASGALKRDLCTYLIFSYPALYSTSGPMILFMHETRFAEVIRLGIRYIGKLNVCLVNE